MFDSNLARNNSSNLYLVGRTKTWQFLLHVALAVTIVFANGHSFATACAQETKSTISTASSEDWSNWRGPENSGSIAGGDYPQTIVAKSATWKTALPGKGCSTPISLQKRIYLTAPDDGQDSLICLDDEGKQQWIAHFGQQNAGKHRNASGSNASPTTDGKAIFAYFKSGTLAAVELDGSVRWKKNLIDLYGDSTLYWDHGTSPVLTNDYVVMARMQHGDSWVAAFDKQTGDVAWKVARDFKTPREGDHGYSTPVVMDFEGTESLLVYGAEHLTIHQASDGKTVWSCGNFNPEKKPLWPTIAMPAVVGNIAVVAGGRNDKGQPLLYGVKLEGSGDVTKTAHVWKRDDTSTFVPSPATWQQRVYLVRDKGEVDCIDPATGKSIWQDKFPKNRNKFYSSPLIAGGKLYAPREDGKIFVADISDDKLTVLSETDLNESVIGSPIPFGNSRILVRGEKHLFCFGD